MSKKELKRIRVANQVRNPLIESIRVSHKSLKNIDYHNIRFNAARKMLFGISTRVDLKKEIIIPENLSDGVYKCRVTYANEIEKVEFEAYTLHQIRSLKLIECNDIDYRFKYANRSKILELYNNRELCDDILIVKNGFPTDTSYANVAFWNGNQWVTPSTPLLAGTARARLLNERSIREAELKVADLERFQKIRIFNAMMDFTADLNDFRIVR